MNNNGRGGGVIEALKTILSSPVGGWAIAIGIVAYMGWFTMKDRQVVYNDLVHLRETAMPLLSEAAMIGRDNQRIVEEAKSVTEDNNRILQEIRSMMNIPLANKQTLDDMNRVLKMQQQEVRQYGQ